MVRQSRSAFVASVGPVTRYHRAVKSLVIAAVVFLAAVHAHAECRSEALQFTSRDQSIELGQYGTMFLEAAMPQCQVIVRDQLARKLRFALSDPPSRDPVLGTPVPPFQRWLAGANVGLAVPTAMQLAAAGLVDPALDMAVRMTIESYRFNVDPSCGANFFNECTDDLSQAAVAYAWSAAYEAKSGRTSRATTFASQARAVIHQALSFSHHLRISDDIVSFNHGFQNVAYGIGLMTSFSSAVIALEEAGVPFEATEEEIDVAWALFREGQRGTATDGSRFHANCYRVIAGTFRSDSPCADAEYLPRMFPVRTFYERAFRNAPNTNPYRFDEIDESLFRTTFINDGRFAVYVVLGERWWHVRPRLEGYRGAPLRVRTVRH